MAYCTEANLIASLSTASIAELTDDVGSETINSTYVSAAITKADNYINGYCRSTFTVPWSSTPALIGSISVDLSIRNLYERRPDLEATETLRDRFKRSEKLLEKIAIGKVQIDDSTSFQNTAGVWSSNKTASDITYTSTEMDKYYP